MPSVRGFRGSKYTKEEDTIVIENILKHPHNLQEAFRQAAEELVENGRATASYMSVERIYYNRLRKEYTLFTLEGRDQSLSNTKIVHRRTRVTYPVENPTVEALARQYNRLTSKQKQDFQVLIK